MTKLEISKADYDKLDDSIKALYKESEKDGVDYELDLGDQIDGLLNAKNHEKKLKQEAEDALKKAQKDAKEANDKAVKLEKDLEESKKNGDVDALNKSWEDKHKTEIDKLNSIIAGKDDFIKETLVDGKAEMLAAELGTSPNALLPHIQSRLSVDFEAEKPTVRVLGVDKKVSALTIDDLKNEIINSSDLASIVKGSQANGGGAHENGDSETGGDGETKGQSLEEKLNGKFGDS